MARTQHGAEAPADAEDDAGHPHTAAAARDRTATGVPGAGGPPTALLTCSLSGTVLTAGAALGRSSGRPLGQVLGVPLHELLHECSHALLQYVLRVARGGAGSGSATFRLRHADGHLVDVPTSWSVLAGASADATQLVFVHAGGAVADLTYGPRARPQLGAAAFPDGPRQQPDRPQLLDAVAEPFHVDDATVQLTASIGVAVAPAQPAVPATDLLRHADTAVHAGKSAGRNRVHVFEQTLDEDVEHRHALTTDLPAALADGAVHLEYQPIVDLRSGAVVGLEALARWTHPERGPVPPSSFVTVAELSGLAPELDRWVLRQALQDVARLRRADVVPRDAYLAVNLSAASLTGTSVLDDLISSTEASGLPATQLVLEITETAIMQDTEVAVRLLRELREHGFRVAMDDFGTGYSSLAHLRDLPVSALKIDRSFVADIAEQRDALAIVAWIVDLARAVGVAVVAEGVETAEQVALLKELGCVTAQGWFWGPAVPVDALLGRRAWSPLTTTVAPVAAPRTPQRDAGVSQGPQRLLELHRDGASATTIAATLNAERLRTPTGVRWHGAGVARVLAHRIRRCAGPPDAVAGPRRLAWR
ncbi:sensor domain-containing protein [Geodermatophilus poikilotrophus]|uniref:sensor domain-containing protein n=1 Tax=Geodermatophilus poikilotrophus TaxID=1333667 RepID=UPI001587DEF3|nr:bifunctional diguanylate cyclase/phosphodiesterase [Geodermatophilus poikilotrophus]